ncbi:hypothetical protein DSECCO2_489480 [anaerobic digester metagenome]
MTNEDTIFYAKELFYRSLPEYKRMSMAERRAMLEDVEARMKERLKYTGEEDEYTVCTRWMLRLENYLNRVL